MWVNHGPQCGFGSLEILAGRDGLGNECTPRNPHSIRSVFKSGYCLLRQGGQVNAYYPFTVVDRRGSRTAWKLPFSNIQSLFL